LKKGRIRLDPASADAQLIQRYFFFFPGRIPFTPLLSMMVTVKKEAK
jgi:hypothetical protein